MTVEMQDKHRVLKGAIDAALESSCATPEQKTLFCARVGKLYDRIFNSEDAIKNDVRSIGTELCSASQKDGLEAFFKRAKVEAPKKNYVRVVLDVEVSNDRIMRPFSDNGVVMDIRELLTGAKLPGTFGGHIVKAEWIEYKTDITGELCTFNGSGARKYLHN